MANTRFKGANASERLTLSTLSDSDMFQTRHLPGTVNDADKGVSKSLLQALPVAVCATAAATAAKVGSLAPESCPDFTLVNGRVIHVYFSAANTASVPTINVAGTGAIPITYPNGDYVGAWAAGTTMDLMYISITVDNTAIERWIVVSSLPVDEVTADNMHSVTSNAVNQKLINTHILSAIETITITTQPQIAQYDGYLFVYILGDTETNIIVNDETLLIGQSPSSYDQTITVPISKGDTFRVNNITSVYWCKARWYKQR